MYCTWFIVYDSLYIVHGIWFIVHGSWYMVHGSLFMVHCTWFIVHGTWYMVNCTWFIVHGSLCMVYCIWFIVYGSLYMVHCTWFMGHGSLYLVHCTWFIVHGSLYIATVVYKLHRLRKQLGPLLFLIYINDLGLSLQNHNKIILFADDTNIFVKAKSLNFAYQAANELLRQINDDMVCKKLHINLEKSCYMHFEKYIPIS